MVEEADRLTTATKRALLAYNDASAAFCGINYLTDDIENCTSRNFNREDGVTNA